jgi:hypothetical protein
MEMTTTTKISPAQQSIIDQMEQGHVLYSMLSTKYLPFDMNPEHGGTLRDPNVHHTISTRTILISTIKAMLAKGLIVEENRYICSSGTWDKHETETWCITYQLPPDEVISDAPPHWTRGTVLTRKGNSHSIGVAMDDTWLRWDGNGYYNRVRWEGSGYVSTVRADRLKPTN